jgi:hypothetical protein
MSFQIAGLGEHLATHFTCESSLNVHTVYMSIQM